MASIVVGVLVGGAALFGAWCDIRGWRDERFRARVARRTGDSAAGG